MSSYTGYALVTGSSGFLGRHMRSILSNRGYCVTAFDRNVTSSELYREATCDAVTWFATDDSKYDVVVHCAAVVGGRQVIDNDQLAVAENLSLDAEMFAWAVRTKQKRVVYISSSAAYPVAAQGAVRKRSLHEDMIALNGDFVGTPDQLYGWSKLMGERMAELACKRGVAVTVVRPFSGYGEDQSTDYPFAAFAERARKREDPFVVWGDGKQVRDWIHVDDICVAIMRTIELGIDGPVNLGTGIGTSMAKLARMFCDEIGYEPVFDFQPDRPSGVVYRVADVNKLNRFYKPKISLEEGIRRALGTVNNVD